MTSVLFSVWSHANITRVKKKMFNACIISKLLYGLDVAWLRQNELARLGAFQTRSLRRICRIQHSYYSRICNIQVLKESSAIQLSSLLAQGQFMLFGKIACKDHALNPIRALVSNSADSFDPLHMNWQRKRRRPRLTWTAEVHKLALNI